MSSARSRMFNFLLRNRHLFTGRLTKETFTMNTSIAAFREQCERGAKRFGKIPPGMEVKPDSLAGIKAEWLIPADAPSGKIILYVHGGGYVSGSCSDHRPVVSKIASLARLTFLTFEYRLAPEHPFPAAPDDSVVVYRHLLSIGYNPGNILVAGESAGGGLMLALLLALKEQGLPMPAAAVAISPWTDLTCSGASYTTRNRRSVAPLNSWHVFSRHYAGTTPANHPLISPLFGDLKGLPPLFICSGEDDELYDDGEQFSQRAREAGVEVTFLGGPNMVHCYPLLAPMFREATEAMDEIIAFIRNRLENPY